MDVVSKIMDDSANSASNPVVIDIIEILKYEGKWVKKWKRVMWLLMMNQE